MELLIVVLTIVLNAIADGYQYKYNTIKLYTPADGKLRVWYGKVYHIVRVLSYLTLLLIAYSTKPIWVLAVSYILLRFGIFDFVFNITTGHHYLYIGDTAMFDRLFRRIFSSANSKMIWLLIKGISIMLGMYIIQNL